jgi:hypothetical protein
MAAQIDQQQVVEDLVARAREQGAQLVGRVACSRS